MPATAWTIQKIDQVDGVVPTAQAIDSANGNKFLNRSGKIRLRFNGATSATGTATVNQQKPNQDGQVRNVVTPANGLDAATKFVELGPFNDRYNDGDGYVQVSYTGTVTNVTCSVIEDADQPGA